MKLDWPDCRNARDVGGSAGADGRPVRARALLRSDDHAWLSAEGVAAVRAAGLARIVDLRSDRECEKYPSPFRDDPAYRHVPMLAEVLGYEPPAETYAPMLDFNRPYIAAAFEAVAAAPPGAVAVHCRSGRDRTGVLVGLLLSVAGVGADPIAADYARTEGCSPGPMLTTLTHLEQRYGGAGPYLTGAGVAPALVTEARERLLG